MVLVVLKSQASLNEVLLWLKPLPWSVTWAFPLRSLIISWACGAQPNPSSSKRCGQQSARCDRQLITQWPPDQPRVPAQMHGLIGSKHSHWESRCRATNCLQRGWRTVTVRLLWWKNFSSLGCSLQFQLQFVSITYNYFNCKLFIK